MAKKFFQTEEFKRISIEWEQKLAQDGLQDIERQVGGERKLKRYASEIQRKRNHPDQIEARIQYYRLLRDALFQAQFDCAVDETIMRLRADGGKIKEICDALSVLGTSKHRSTVRLIIRKYEQRWGVRNWNPNQLAYNWTKKKKLPIR